MPRQRFDMGSKWLLQNQGKGALFIGGFTDVRRIEAMPGEIVQNRKYPDGLLRVYLGGERMQAEWKTVELWTLSAEQFLGEGDVGVTPWVPLMEFTGPPEALLERCAAKIEREAKPKERADLLAVSQVLGGLKFPPSLLMEFFAGEQTMFESPVLQQFVAGRFHEAILDILKDRFGSVPRDVSKLLRAVIDEKKLRKFNVLAAKCPNLDAFREALLS